MEKASKRLEQWRQELSAEAPTFSARAKQLLASNFTTKRATNEQKVQKGNFNFKVLFKQKPKHNTIKDMKNG